jgi:CheY-like chemotaxis protein
MFRQFACELLEATNGEEGLAVALRTNPDLIILDYNMPTMDDIDMLRKMREDPGMKRTLAIMLSANSGLQSLPTVARLGVPDDVTKPFRGEELLAKVGRIIPLISLTES